MGDDLYFDNLMMSGLQMTEQEAAECEHEASATSSLDCRIRLLAYYAKPPRQFDAVSRHLTYLIDSHPTLPILRDVVFERSEDERAYAEIESAWLKVASSTTDLRILYNAHRALRKSSFAEAEALLLRGLAVPEAWENCDWQRAALDFYYFHAHRTDDESLMARAAEAAVEVINLTTTSIQHHASLPPCLLALIEARELSFARELAEEALNKRGFLEQMVQYHGHLVLGLLACNDGDIESAVSHLKQSVTCVEGWYSEHALEPPLLLAQALLTLGQKSAVREFLVELQPRWVRGGHRVEPWIADLDKGILPRLDRDWIRRSATP